MTKRIKKGNKTHIVALYPTCTSGNPWTIHVQTEYTLLQINMMTDQVMLSQQMKPPRTSEEWLKLPARFKYYKDDWCLSNM
jgi:hypothetical protein